ncbi:hypothetical protein KAI04_00050 [Candidatus Pacearchaeota archaeon]|nr:hypothetical protein [Candidatus Pacearchaeota archaeon]
MRDYIIVDEFYKLIRPQSYKRIKLRKGNSMVLTTLDRLIFDIIYLFLTGEPKREAIITDIYKEVRSVLNCNKLGSDKIKCVIYIMYMKKIVSMKHIIKNKYQNQFRDYIKLL